MPNTLEKNQIWTVSHLTEEIKSLLSQNFFSITVRGEISNLREQSSGHIYFSLKDENAQISCVLFRGQAAKLERKPKAGDEVIIEGGITVYPPRGSYQIVVSQLTYQGVGELLLQFHKLKEELSAKGYFDRDKKKPLPPFPKTIGVITSPTGSVIQDIIHVLTRRLKKFHLILHPVRVQGKGAEFEIARAVDEMNAFNLADVLIVGRGGGSLEDLWPFNEKVVADALFNSRIPIVSAVGHETDFSISDWVSDIRAPTPSAAAEIVSKERTHLIESLRKLHGHLNHSTLTKFRHLHTGLKYFASHPLFTSPYGILELKMQKFDDVSSQLGKQMHFLLEVKKGHLERQSHALRMANPIHKISEKRRWLFNVSKQLIVVLKKIEEQKAKLSQIHAHLKSVNPKNILKKGYCIPFRENQASVIMASSAISKDDQISLLFHDGQATATIDEIQPHKV